MMNGPATLDLNNRDVAARFHVSNSLKIGDYLWTNLVSASRHHPFFKVGARDARYRAIVLNTQEQPPALEIGKRN
jgi:hypothetical protein